MLQCLQLRHIAFQTFLNLSHGSLISLSLAPTIEHDEAIPTVSFSSRRVTSRNSNVRGLSFIAVLHLGEQANDTTTHHWPLTARRQVCKSLNHIIKTYSGMQYIIKLDTNGMEATCYSLPHVDLLQKLRDRLKAWEQLDRKRYRVIPSGNFGECRAYELVAGTFSTSDGSNLFVIWLPSATNDGRVLRRKTIGLSVRDFAIDPTEDIIVFLEDGSKFVILTLLLLNPHLFLLVL